MDQFLKKHKLLKLTQHGTDHMNSLTIIKKIDFIIKKFSRKKLEAQMGSLENSSMCLKN